MKQMFLAVLALMAFSFNVSAVESKALHFCGGAAGGFYDGFADTIGKDIVQKSGGLATVEIIKTKGSVDSASKLKNGTCDIAILQADAVTSRPMPNDITTTDAHQEAIFWIHPVNGPVKDFADLSKEEFKNYGVAIVDGSGAEVTLRNIGNVDKDFKDLNVIGFKNWRWAAKAVAEGKVRKSGNDLRIAGMIYVGLQGRLSSEITGEFREQLNIGQVEVSAMKNVKDFNGTPMYVSCPIVNTNGLDTSNSWGKPDTFCLRAQVVYNNDVFKDMEDQDAEALQTAVDKAVVQGVKNQKAAK